MMRISSGELLFRLACAVCAGLIIIILVTISISLLYGSWPAIKTFGLDFFWDTNWDPVNKHFGGFIPIFGTLATSFIALFFSIPLSFGIAIFIVEYAPNAIRSTFINIIELLAAIPSIIYGMWGLFVLAPLLATTIQPLLITYLHPLPFIGVLFSGPPLGIGILTAGLILGIMIIPFIAVITYESLSIVPPMLKESAYALGATQREVIWHISFRYSKTAIMGGVMLGLGRALGETIAVAFVIGNTYRFSSSLLAPGNTIASSLANEFTEALDKIHMAALIELGLILLLISFFVLISAEIFLRYTNLQKRAVQ
jgi:phosphate transport system permease protein